jgi:hypothetical protein
MEIEAQGDTAVQATDAMTVKQTACTPPTHPTTGCPNPFLLGDKQKTSTYFQIRFLPVTNRNLVRASKSLSLYSK